MLFHSVWNKIMYLPMLYSICIYDILPNQCFYGIIFGRESMNGAYVTGDPVYVTLETNLCYMPLV